MLGSEAPGTFRVSLAEWRFFFYRMNTRVQVEQPVFEM